MHNHLLKLLAENRRATARRPLALRALGANEAEIFLYDIIVDSELEAEWWGGIAPEPFSALVREASSASKLHLRINSPGGSVYAARAMETALREYKGTLVTHVDGVAASAATLLAVAGKERLITKGAQFMIHKAWTWSAGNEDDYLKMAGLLGKTDGQLAETYADITGKPIDELLSLMRAETWYTGREAVDAGFATALAEDAQASQASAQGAAGWVLNAYAHAPQPSSAPTPPAPPAAPAQPTTAQADAAALLRRLNTVLLPA